MTNFHRLLCRALLSGLVLSTPAHRSAPAAEEAPAAPSFDELQAMIARMQARIDQLGSSSAERDTALRFLEQQVDQAAGQITGSGEANEALRGETAALATRLQDIARDRDRLTGEADERSSAVASLQAQIEALTSDLGREREAGAQLSTALATSQARESELTAKLAALEQGASASATAAAERIAKAEAETEQLRRALDEVNRQLAAAETKVDEQQEAIEGLDERLAQALRQRVEELEQYRSEFFGRLRAALGDRPDLRVVGDRFVFQSELLFASGSAKLDPDGEAQLRALARTLKGVAAQIPPEVDWILRVDGHTDRLPIRDGLFASNWELSVARAISVLDFLIRQGIPPQRLAAAGFGEYRPLDPRDDEVAYRRNRRIEFKLTEG